MFPLISASDLAVYIIGAVRETLDTEEATSKYRKYRKRVRDQDATVEDVAGDVQDDGVTITTITVEDIYTRSAQSQYNQDIWYGSPNLAAGRRLVSEVGVDFLTIFSPRNQSFIHLRLRDLVSPKNSKEVKCHHQLD